MRATRARKRLAGAIVVVASSVATLPASAQTSAGTCTSVVTGFNITVGPDACTKARDLFAVMMPQVGTALAGGNPVLGEGGTLGGWGKRVISARLTAVDGWVPARAVPVSLTAPVSRSDFGATRAAIPMPSVDAAIGLFAGIPAGLTNIGGVDVLLGATFMPEIAENEVSVSPQTSSFAVGYGVRVGALQESSLVPGVSLSYMRRRLPTTTLRYHSQNDTLGVQELAATANSVRLVASKRLAIFGLAAGVGRDELVNTARMDGVVNESVGGVPSRAMVSLFALRNEVTRNTAFVNLSLGLPMARLVGELGWSSAGDADPTVNVFDGRPANGGYRYGSLGVTVRF